MADETMVIADNKDDIKTDINKPEAVEAASENIDDIKSKYQELQKKALEYEKKEAEAKKAEAKKIEQELKDANKFKELADKYNNEKLELANRISELEAIKAEYDIILAEREAERKSLLKKLPDDIRVEFENASMKQINLILSRFGNLKQADSGVADSAGRVTATKPPENMTPFERVKWGIANAKSI